MMKLPRGIELIDYAGDVVLIGSKLDKELFNEIMAELPEADRRCVIGWRTVAKGGVANREERLRAHPG